MSLLFVVQAYKAKGSRLVGQASTAFEDPDDALAEGAHLARWRAGVVVLRQDVDDDGMRRGRPIVLAIHGQVPEGWFDNERAAA